MKQWIGKHPDLWEFILFNILSNCATVTNFIVMWLCTGFVFKYFSGQPFQLFIFNYVGYSRKHCVAGDFELPDYEILDTAGLDIR